MNNGWNWSGQGKWYIYWAPTEELLGSNRRRMSAVATTLEVAIQSYDRFNMDETGYKILIEQLQPTVASEITSIFVASGVWDSTLEEFLAASGVTS